MSDTSKSNKPIISVIMPAYNVEKYIKDAIESILQQTFNNFEFIIIDDSSTDQTVKLIHKYSNTDRRIIFIKNKEKSGLSKSLNRGIAFAKGKYVTRMDADDWSYPDRLARQYKFMEANPKIGISGGAMEVYDWQMKNLIALHKYHADDKSIRDHLFLHSPFSHPAIICRRAALIKVGGYNERIDIAEDYDLYFRLGLHYSFGNLPDILLKYRKSSNSTTFSNYLRSDQMTLFIRMKAVFEYGYEMRWIDKIVFVVQLISLVLIPSKLRKYFYDLFLKQNFF